MTLFSSYMKEGLLKNKTHNELLRELHLGNPTFQGVDTVTLSRWANSRTVPSLSKQLLIAMTTNTLELFFDFHDGAEIKTPKTILNTYNRFLQQHDQSYHHILMAPVRSTIKQEFLTWEQYVKRTSFIRNKTNFLTEVNDNISDIEDMGKICFFSISDENGRLISYSSVVFNMYCLSDALGVNGNELKDAIGSLASYHYNSHHGNILRGLILNHAITDPKKYYTYIMRGKVSMELAELMGSTLLKSHPERNAIGNYYIYKSRLHDILGSPTCLPFIISTRKMYKELMTGKEIELPCTDCQTNRTT